MGAAKLGLELLSRKIEGMGPEPGSPPEARQAAAAKWRQWYNAIKPLDLEGQDDDSTSQSDTNTAKSKG
jgi:hypothetical protein